MNIYYILILFLLIFLLYKNDNKCLKPKFNPYLWNKKGFRKNNNCYSYAIRNLKKIEKVNYNREILLKYLK